MNETILTIAQRIGVSASTVSRVLSGQSKKYRISDSTTELVMKVARECNFVPNHLAQSLIKKHSNTIGLLLPSLINPFFAEMAHVVVGEMRNAGYTTILINTTEDEQSFNDSLNTLVSRQVDGIIAAPCGNNPALPEKIDKEKVPVILIDRFYPGSNLSYVTSDNYKGGFDATRYLIEKGHRNIACINGVDNISPIIERRRGYMDAMHQAGLDENISISGDDSTIENGYLEMQLLLGRKNRPSAVFALGNTIAMGAIMAAKEVGIRIPEDISIVSYDNHLYLDLVNPAPTRVSQPIENIARLATKLLLSRLSGAQAGAAQIKLTPEIIEGKSVRSV